MNSQEKKDLVDRYNRIDSQISRECEELSKWRCRATKVTPTLSDMPKGGETVDKIQSSVEKIVEIEGKINAGIDELVKIKTKAMLNGVTLKRSRTK